MKRKLTTILCADAAGFSERMSRDEPGTLAALKRQREAMETLFERHDGRKINTWGDAVIAEFPSVVEAVQCAIDIQTDIAGQKPDGPGADGLPFRIGINLGDVMIDGDDLIGDGVNIAARLQEIAEPGGIAISRSVFDQVNRKLDTRIEPPTTAVLKNIDTPIEVYRIRLGGGDWPDGSGDADFLADVPAPQRATTKSATEPRPFRQMMHDALEWYRGQTKRVQTGVGIIAFLAAINLLTNPASIWFHWPALPIFFFVIWPVLFGRNKDDGAEPDKGG